MEDLGLFYFYTTRSKRFSDELAGVVKSRCSMPGEGPAEAVLLVAGGAREVLGTSVAGLSGGFSLLKFGLT